MSSMTLFILLVSIIAVLFLTLNLLFAPHNPYAEKFSSFECGFHSFLGQNRSQFNIKFFIFGLLFLLFDLEITLIFPFAVSQPNNEIYGLIVVLMFLVVITLGFVYELGKGALKIDSKQGSTSNLSHSTNLSISYLGKGNITLNNKVSLSKGGTSFNIYGARSYYRQYHKVSLASALHSTSFSLGRDLRKGYPVIVGGKGNFLFTSDGRKVFDASSGAAVSCLGYGNNKVMTAVIKLINTGTPYLASSFWASGIVEDLCKELIRGTEGKMARVYLTGSGSEAMEAAIKMSRQYFYEKDNKTPRVNYIAREGSYHGNTIGALGVSGHLARRAPYIPLLMVNIHHVSSCNPYRQRLEGESNAAFVARKAAELEAKFQELGPDTVIGFIAEPVVGAALGCVPNVPGYLKAMREVCHKHGALFILDEVMCGMGRTGTLHAWQAEDVVPDILTMGKGLGAGYQPIAAMMISEKILKVLLKGSGQFIHGQTYQSMPVQAAAALEVLRIIQEEKLMDNVSKQGAYLEKRLKVVLGDHPNIGDIRGRGLFWGLEFVKDKGTKEPFDLKYGVAQKILDLAISPGFNMTVYPGTGTVDGVQGDHIILAPSYIVTEEEVDHIVKVVSAVVHNVFKKISTENI